jgi:hypothetical protein
MNSFLFFKIFFIGIIINQVVKEKKEEEKSNDPRVSQAS